jgi:LuxR family transcriptional regulator, maltose regulon positive regulatory protein
VAAAASLLEVIADEAPGDSNASALAWERDLGLAKPDRVFSPALIRMALGLLERQARYRPAEAALISAVADLLGGVSAPAPPPGEPAWPGEPFTESETRVLRYLPTDMGAPEIAAELYFSANAVKTHLRHLYATSARTAATRPYSAPGHRPARRVLPPALERRSGARGGRSRPEQGGDGVSR